MSVEFKGACMGVRLEHRGPDDNHICVVTMIEDDTNWFDKSSFSSAWLDEMIERLQAARDYMESNAEPDPSGFGWRFK